MAYNKAKEEKKWRLWKEAEEKQLHWRKRRQQMCKRDENDKFAHW